MPSDQRERARFEPIETEHLVLRPVRPDDVDSLWRRRNDESTARFQAWDVPYPRERAQGLIDAVVELDGVPPGDGWFQISVDDRETSQPVGDLALHLTFGGRVAELGWTVAAEARGRGVATEAAAALAAWCFETLRVSRVSAQMHPDNSASTRVAEHLGMVFEGRTRNSYWLDRADGTAENSDDIIYAMTPDDWRTWAGRPRSTPDEVQLVEMDHTRVDAALALATHHSQRSLVAPMEVSLVQAAHPRPHEGDPVVPWQRLIEADGEIVGYVLVAAPTERFPTPYLWRFLVDRMHQRRGIGRLVLDMVAEQARSWGANALEVSWVPGPGSPEPLYRQFGFEPTGKIEHGEVEGRVAL